MTDVYLNTECTNSPLAFAPAVLDVVLPHASEDVAGTLVRETLPCELIFCHVGRHTLAETTASEDANAADLLHPQGVHDVADGRLGAGQRGSRGVLGQSLQGGGGVVGLRGHLGLLSRQSYAPDGITDDPARGVAAIFQFLGDEPREDVRVQFRLLELGEVEFDGLAVGSRKERLEWRLHRGAEQVGGKLLCSATDWTC